MDIEKLWNEGNKDEWNSALEAYYRNLSVAKNNELEKKMDNLSFETIQKMSVQEFYDFLYNEYFVWKYTASNRLATTRGQLKKHMDNGLIDLEKIQKGIFKGYMCDPEDTDYLLYKTQQIHGLGTAGASGLLSVLFPKYYGTLDQFLVYSLLRIKNLPEYSDLEKMNPNGLTIKDGVLLEDILRRKSRELNERLEPDTWTPRRIDMVLWSARSN